MDLAEEKMNYSQVLEWIYSALPMFQKSGASAYKPGLDSTFCLMDYLGNPEKGLVCIHVAGTNGKGSVSNMLASILMESGYRTGAPSGLPREDTGRRAHDTAAARCRFYKHSP